MSDALWVVTTAGVVIVIAIAIGWVFVATIGGRTIDAGSVSDQWVAEHRADSGNGVGH